MAQDMTTQSQRRLTVNINDGPRPFSAPKIAAAERAKLKAEVVVVGPFAQRYNPSSDPAVKVGPSRPKLQSCSLLPSDWYEVFAQPTSPLGHSIQPFFIR